MHTTDDLDAPVDEAAVIQPPPEDDGDTHEHDAFGGSTPVDDATTWTAARGSGTPKSAWAWMAAGFVAIAVASGAFFGMRNTANTATNASANGAPNANANPNGPAGAPNFPGADQGGAGQAAPGRGGTGAQGQGPTGQGQGQGQGSVGDVDGPRGGPRDGTFGLLQSVDRSTLTLQTRDGATVKVTTTASTQVTKIVDGTPQTAALSDLTVGEPVMVRGTAGSDGTVAATAIVQGRPPRGQRGPGGPDGGGFGPPPDGQAPDSQAPAAQQQNVRNA